MVPADEMENCRNLPSEIKKAVLLSSQINQRLSRFIVNQIHLGKKLNIIIIVFSNTHTCDIRINNRHDVCRA